MDNTEMYLVKYDEGDGEGRIYMTFTNKETMLKWMNGHLWRHILSVELIKVIKSFDIGYTLTEK